MNGNFKNAIQLFRSGEYEEAVRVFDTIIRSYQLDFKNRQKEASAGEEVSYNRNFLNALDCMSASLMKLDRFKRALKYAERMILLDRYSIKGYLRIGKIYQCLGDYRQSYNILKKGYLTIKQGKLDRSPSLKINDALYCQLKDGLKHAKEKISESNSSGEIHRKDLDPLKLLPYELINNIFAMFPTTFNLHCLCVSRYWHDTLLNIPHIYEDYRLKKNIRKQDFERFMKFIYKVNKNGNDIYLKSVNIEPHDTAEQSVLSLFFKTNIHLEQLYLNLNTTNYYALQSTLRNGNFDLSFLKDLNLRIPLFINDSTNLEYILNQCPNLSKLVISIPKFDNRSKLPKSMGLKLHNLEFLSVIAEKNSYRNKLNSILIDSFLSKNNFPNLKHLTLSRTAITVDTFYELITDGLEILEIDSIPGISMIHISDALLRKSNGRSGHLKELKVVEIDTTMDLSHRDWNDLLLNSKIFWNLKILMLRNSCISPSFLYALLLGSSCQLEHLHLILNSNIIFENKLSSSIPTQSNLPYGYTDIINIVSKIPKIKELSLVGCIGFNNMTLKTMVKFSHSHHSFDNLRYLNLSMNKIDGSGLLSIFKQPYDLKLQTLVIQYCNVDPNTVKYLRDKNLCGTIDYKMSERVVL